MMARPPPVPAPVCVADRAAAAAAAGLPGAEALRRVAVVVTGLGEVKLLALVGAAAAAASTPGGQGSVTCAWARV